VRVARSRLRDVARSAGLRWAVALALGLSTASVMRSSLDRASAAEARLGRLTPVVALVRPVSVGDVVVRRDIGVVRRPASMVPDGAARAVGDVEGRVALVDLVPGEVVVGSRLAPEGRRGAAALLPPGQRAVAVPGGAARPPQRPRDRVDVLATTADGETHVVVVGAVVVDVDDGRDVVTIAVPSGDAAAIASAVAATSVTLALSG
jgi:Flp pilus assembly protein CpaB